MRKRFLLLAASLLAGCLDFDQFAAGPDASSPALDGATLPDAARAPHDLTVAEPDLARAPDLGGVCPQTTSCYNGGVVTVGVGVCVAGRQTCVDGVFGVCAGEIDPTPESCNGLDDNCNGQVDEDLGTITCGVGGCAVTVPACAGGAPVACTPADPKQEICGNGVDDDCNGLVDDGCACVAVAPSGDDAMGNGHANAPFLTIGKAIAAAGSDGLPNLVCVASGPSCPSQFSYNESVKMRDGVSVFGGYQASQNAFLRHAGCTTTIADVDGVGVLFDGSVMHPTALDGFTIAGAATATGAGVTITGAQGAVLSNDVITGGGTDTSIGVDVSDAMGKPAQPLITLSAITGGNGASLSVAVRSVNSSPQIVGNCDGVDGNGRCSVGCGAQSRFLLGRAPGGAGAESYGVRLDASPGALIDGNGICVPAGATVNAVGVHIAGDASRQLLHANFIEAGGAASNAVGVWAEHCAGASPWIFDNALIAANSTLPAGHSDGVRAIGDCHPRIDTNAAISGGDESGAASADGVHCEVDPGNGLTSRCTILGNGAITGSVGAATPTAVGVTCEDFCCARIERNSLITGGNGTTAIGLALGATGAFVNANRIDAGCGTAYGIGLYATGTFARVQNNLVNGLVCEQPMIGTTSVAVAVIVGSGGNEIDLDSNDLLGQGGGATCTSRGISFQSAMLSAPAGPSGMVRNNIIDAGACAIRFGVQEAAMNNQVRLLQNNDLYATKGLLTALLQDGGQNNLLSAAALNALVVPGATISGNISADPGFVNGHQFSSTSACVDSGTSVGAPATDSFGTARPQRQGFDIGYFELPDAS